ncbi:MAG: hypothetical protein WC856_05665 [Methylococcaceae bacterium]
MKINARFSCSLAGLVCSGFQATEEDARGSTKEEAMAILSEWEMLTGVMQPLPTMNDRN